MQFTKLFNSILDSTIWQESNETKILWITMLAMSDRNGEVYASVPGLARRAGVSLEQCEVAIESLMSPDKHSRTLDHEGRRVSKIDGGWVLLNHGKYRALLSVEERKEYNRRKQAERRALSKNVKLCQTLSMTVNDSQLQSAMSAHTEAEAEAEDKISKPNGFSPPLGEGEVPSLILLSDTFVPKTELKHRVNAIFHRRETTHWDDGEEKALKQTRVIHEDLDLVEKFFKADVPPDVYRRKTVEALLNNFNGEVDKARDYFKRSKKKDNAL